MLFCCQVAEIFNQAFRKGVQSFWLHCCDHCCTLILIYLDGERFCLLLGVTAHFNNYSYLQAGIHKQPEAKQTATTQVYVIFKLQGLLQLWLRAFPTMDSKTRDSFTHTATAWGIQFTTTAFWVDFTVILEQSFCASFVQVTSTVIYVCTLHQLTQNATTILAMFPHLPTTHLQYATWEEHLVN